MPSRHPWAWARARPAASPRVNGRPDPRRPRWPPWRTGSSRTTRARRARPRARSRGPRPPNLRGGPEVRVPPALAEPGRESLALRVGDLEIDAGPDRRLVFGDAAGKVPRDLAYGQRGLVERSARPQALSDQGSFQHDRPPRRPTPPSGDTPPWDTARRRHRERTARGYRLEEPTARAAGDTLEPPADIQERPARQRRSFPADWSGPLQPGRAQAVIGRAPVIAPGRQSQAPRELSRREQPLPRHDTTSRLLPAAAISLKWRTGIDQDRREHELRPAEVKRRFMTAGTSLPRHW
jgi:hypothetical protein